MLLTSWQISCKISRDLAKLQEDMIAAIVESYNQIAELESSAQRFLLAQRLNAKN
jgi:hypothetical protein